ncbi:MAG TPA: hypothetical protein DD636_08610 [Anaerolineaceae bacterium]|nr:hypothetical protein [Anaerolineaceae bacterium]
MSETKLWLISPRDPLIFRNGKPFTAAPGSRAETLPMPFPGTISGAVRTKAWTNSATGVFDKSRINDPYVVRGPLLVELDSANDIIAWFFPPPADAVFFETANKSKKEADLFDLKPMPALYDVLLDSKDMVLCGFEINKKEKTFKSPPSFWNWQTLLQWLDKPVSQMNVDLDSVGISHLPVEYRIHVAMVNALQSAKEGALFQTSGVEFDYQTGQNSPLKKNRRFGLVAISDLDLHGGGLGFVGGEKRFVNWIPLQSKPPFESCTQNIRDEIEDSGFCRLLLITPAYFGGKNRPQKILANLGVEVIAIINNRFQTVSGWDYQTRKPKPTKHLVPAGSILFLKLSDDIEKRKQFIDLVWGQTIGDDPQLCSDGYGLSLLGTWDGDFRSMNMEDAHDQ